VILMLRSPVDTIFLDDQIAPSTQQTLEAHLKDPQILQASLDDPVKEVNQGLIVGLVLGRRNFKGASWQYDRQCCLAGVL